MFTKRRIIHTNVRLRPTLVLCVLSSTVFEIGLEWVYGAMAISLFASGQSMLISVLKRVWIRVHAQKEEICE